ncbi:MFS transporter [Kribbella sp. NPDC005582]|uniref:MFS transporter n=1 Tax=Kribbella sp. NPDC005582 TaxID=3156893 RepID=UPI00339DCA48
MLGLRSYYGAATLARLSDEMVAFTIVLLVLERTDSPGLAGLTGAAYALPAIATGPLLGAWLDRTAYRRAALCANQAILAVVMLVLVVVVGHTPHWITPVLAAVAGTTLPMVSGGFTSMLPSLVPQPKLARANSLEAASFGAASMIGPAAAATISATVSVDAAAAVIAVTAVLSIVAITRLPALPPASTTPEPFLATVSGGIAHLLGTPRLRASTVTSTALMGATGFLLITLPLHMPLLGAPKAAAGYLWTALEVGSVAAAILVARWQNRWRPELVVIVAVAAYGLAIASWPLAGSLAALLVLAVVSGLFEGPMIPAMFAARQQYSPLALQGRVSTTAASLRVGASALGQAAGGLLVPLVGTPTALLLVAAGLLVASGLGLLTG